MQHPNIRVMAVYDSSLSTAQSNAVLLLATNFRSTSLPFFDEVLRAAFFTPPYQCSAMECSFVLLDNKS